VQAGNSCDTDEATQQDTLALLSPNATVVARDLYIKQAGAPGVSRTYGLRFEGTDTSVSCTLGAADTTCNSGGATATIPPGSRILLKIVSGDAANGNGFWLGWRATTP
jgi:hypothetical protein